MRLACLEGVQICQKGNVMSRAAINTADIYWQPITWLGSSTYHFRPHIIYHNQLQHYLHHHIIQVILYCHH